MFVKKVRRDDEDVLVMVRWASEQTWKKWEKSPEHIAGHKAKIGQPKPDFIIESSHTAYEQII